MSDPGSRTVDENRIKDTLNSTFHQYGLQIRIKRVYKHGSKDQDNKPVDIGGNCNFAYDLENDRNDPHEKVAAIRIMLDLIRHGKL